METISVDMFINMFLTDMAFGMYCINQVLLSILVVLYIGEWIRIGASEFFRYITWLFCALWFENLFAIYARSLVLLEPEFAVAFFQTFCWKTRFIPFALVLIIIIYNTVSRMCQRRKVEHFLAEKAERRKIKRRDADKEI